MGIFAEGVRLFWILSLFIGSAVGSEYLYNNTPQYRLYDTIFTGYNNKLRPRYNPEETVEVGLEFELNTVSGLDEVNQVMTTVGFVVAIWYDDFICWNESDYDGLRHFVVQANTVWLPDIGLKNSADEFYDISYSRDFRVDIRSDGRILWAFGGNFHTSCILDMTFFPFDLQQCDIDVENWAYTNESVHLYHLLDEVHLLEFSENGEWQLDHTETKLEYFEEDTHPGKPFPRALFSIFITRKFRYYIINIMTPALFVITISLTVFWLPPDSGEKVSLGITALLSFSVFQLIIMENTPRTSDYTPVMTMLLTCIMGMSTFSVLTSIIVLYFYHHIANKRPNKVMRFVFFKLLARIVCMKSRVPDENQVIPLLDQTVHRSMPAKRDDVIVQNELPNEYSSDDVIKVRPASPDKDGADSAHLKEIVEHMRKTSRRVDKRERDELIMDEWKAIANVLDRTFFWFAFIIVTITVPLFMLRQDKAH